MRSIVNALGFGLVLLLISGCASQPNRIEVSATPVDRPELTLPNADRLNMRDIKWIIVTNENYEEVFNDLQKDGSPVALFGVTDKGYENLSLNLSDLRAYIQQQNAIIAAYENYYVESNRAIDDANQQIQQTQEEIDSQQQQEPSVLNRLIPFK